MTRFAMVFVLAIGITVAGERPAQAASSLSTPPVLVAESAPTTGLYASQQYASSELAVSRNVVYSVRDKTYPDQFTSGKNHKRDKKASNLVLELDVYVPPNASAASPQPLVVWIHGGGYTTGAKEKVSNQTISYATAGYVSASVNYRLTPANKADPGRREVAQQQATEDVMNAIRHLKANAATYHIDTTRVATIGEAAGGGISLVNAIEFDTLAGTVSDYPGVSSVVTAAVSSGATLVQYGQINPALTFDPSDSWVRLYHAKETDGHSGATWSNEVQLSQTLINEGSPGPVLKCTTVPQANMTHVVSLKLGGYFWTSSLRDFIWDKLNLQALVAP